MSATVSVLLPVRNAESTIGVALSSILCQSIREFEVLVVDDASTDATAEVASRWAERDPRVRLLSGGGGGIVEALELARGEASADLLARMDADDVALPTRLQEQVRLMGADSRVGICGTAIRYVPDEAVAGGARRYESWLNGLTCSDALHRDRFIECPLAHPTWLMRSSAVRAVGGYQDGPFPEDYDLLLRVVQEGWKLATVPSVRLLWREDPDRLSRRDRRYDTDAFARCKARHLRAAFPGRDGVVVWGAGPTGKTFSRGWRSEGGTLRAFVEIDPRKIGQEIHGAPVVAREDLHHFRNSLGVAAVGRDGARDEVRAGFTEQGWEEGVDFVAVA